MELKEEDVIKFLSCSTHAGTTNADHQMLQYVFKRSSNGESIRLYQQYRQIFILLETIIIVQLHDEKTDFRSPDILLMRTSISDL